MAARVAADKLAAVRAAAAIAAAEKAQPNNLGVDSECSWWITVVKSP
jgi:hypothetical protein